MLKDETVVTFSEAAATLPKLNGRKLHASTLWRWARKGLKGVKLETRRLGGRFVTSLEALDRFSEKLAKIGVEEPAPMAPAKRKSPNSRHQHEVDRAERECDEAGI